MKNRDKILWKYRFPEKLILSNYPEKKSCFTWKAYELPESRHDPRNIILHPIRMIHIDGTCLTASIWKTFVFQLCFLERLFWSLI